ncbi:MULTISPECIES: UDP-glucose dehydrogenase family protein [Rhizobium/Agrobacterium group]|uniref:UDP-glucose 6-dehydrogenase n=2 Tax=Rhizobium/Agrobacterium group TaxID=227290 RepID=B9JUS9_ALLAM|nr:MULTISPECIES: UDP-glucose/GDP-mannose dehydrogenase family protein [Rhizobium/Agrobacterium group]ACM36074.1 UDP-glucose 6-dehydrogenase [Allorhizobium ampelinum S4]MCF1449518.1 UDP-glucose/GDP-mannose dehydrogenase family protein [Allorhizobium ampelinum]MCF1472753.1 UDP-glucose/GDP-mannose dehydrogenase family protein [Allorhizobium ampelinum]MCF1482003.1 UDP-glucose/GDP-mannose dehydrogenase family protein [Allorhizobium ampelinum]MUO29712.1 nucleotide sugar dehydrogenase [Agrobacterium 
MNVRITMVGTGYVGLVSGACFAELGHDVICVDKDPRKIEMLHQGKMPIYEPGLDELVQRNVAAGRITFTTDLAASVKDRDAVFIAVGTPTEAGSDRADLKYVFAAAAEIAKAVTGFTVIVTKSTVPVGTNRQVFDIAKANAAPDVRIAVASNPEFLREGAAIKDFLEPDRIVVGVDTPQSGEVMERIYAPLLLNGNVPFFSTGIETAELIKYAANAFLAVKISFINEMANLCEAVGATVEDVAHGIGLDKRIGRAFLNTGPGWGGSCFPKDTRALLATAADAGIDSLVVSSAVNANNQRKADMVTKVIEAAGGDVEGKKIAVLGVTFKGQTDDMRESTSLVMLPALQAKGAKVAAFDPSSPHDAASQLPGVEMTKTAKEAATGADVLVILTDWMVFKTYNFKEIASVMASPVLVDLRNMFNANEAQKNGFSHYVSLGR